MTLNPTPLAQLAQYVTDAANIALYLTFYTLATLLGVNPFED